LSRVVEAVYERGVLRPLQELEILDLEGEGHADNLGVGGALPRASPSRSSGTCWRSCQP